MTTQLLLDLAKAKALLMSGHCRDVFARRADGRACSVTSPEAVQFDLVGALARATETDITERDESPRFQEAARAIYLTYVNREREAGNAPLMIANGTPWGVLSLINDWGYPVIQLIQETWTWVSVQGNAPTFDGEPVQRVAPEGWTMIEGGVAAA